MTVTVLPSASMLPQAIDARWRPLRAGLGDIWHYDDQVFEFYRGNLILRGANESGKTKALELLLPFLLDASTDARRLDPFGHGDRRMRWNLLGGTEAEPEQEQRNSWLWLEFGRLNDGGEPVCVTIGARLRATRGAKSELIHYFITDQRIGEELELWESDEAGGRHALSADGLAERIGQRGEIFDTRIGGRRERYRNVVDERLFGLGPERYEALINLLLAVRRPQLSQRLEPEALREFLDTALPPLDSVIVAEQADSLEGLRLREEVLDETKAAARAVGEFLGVYRDYATGQMALHGAELRTAHSAYDAGREKVTAAAQSLEAATITETAANDRRRQIADETARITGEIGALERSEAFRNAQALEQAGQAADEARRLAVSAASRETAATTAHQAQTERHDRLVKRRDRNRQELGAKLRTAATAAQMASFVDEHRALDGLLADHDPEVAQLALTEATQLEQARSVVVDDLRRRWREIEPLERAETLAADAARRASSEREAAADEAMTAEAGTGAVLRALAERVTTWAESLREIVVEPGALDDLDEQLTAGEALRPRLEAVAEPAKVGLAAARARAELERSNLVGQRDQIEAELEAVRASASIGPASSPTRPASRAARDGAPFYALVDFVPGLTASDQAGLEAALEAAGILDAWIMPDGSLLGPDVLDAAFDPASPRAGTGATLRSALRPVDGLAVPTELVARALDAIALGSDRPASVAVGLDGSYRVGPLVGRFEKTDAEFIGAGARELTRERAIARLEARISEMDDSIANVDVELQQVVRREERLARERTAAPDDKALVDARAAERSAQKRLELATGLEVEAATRHATAGAALGLARDELRAMAAKSRLADQLERLDELHDGLTTYRGSLGVLASLLVLLTQDTADLAEAESAEAAARKALEGAARETGEAGLQAETRQSTYGTLKRTVGASVAQILTELEAARGRHDKLKDDAATAQRDKDDALRAVAGAETRLEGERGLQAEREQERNGAAERFRTLAAVPDLLDLVIDAPPDGPTSDWSVTQTVDVARAVFRATGSRNVDRTELNAATNEVYTRYRTLQSQLGDDYRLEQQVDDGMFVPVVHRAGQPQTIVSLRAGLDHDVDQMTADLSKREREVFEDFLLGQVGRHLGERIREAHDLVEAMNEILAQVKLPDGDRVRLHWAVDPLSAAGVGEAVGLLRRDPSLLDEGHWEAIIEFFRSQVEIARERDSDGTWAERLARAIDYRHWHRFEIEEVDSAGHHRFLTKKSHGTGSGGEKSVKLHLPLLAALAAHYSSAALFAPRLLLLDEAFAGIDDVVRGRLYGLLDQFDFSFFATAFGEWGMYAELSGTAVYHLVHRAELQAVHAEHFIWTGSEFLHASELAAAGAS